MSTGDTDPPGTVDHEAAVPGAGFVHLQGGGVSLLLDARGPGLPSVVHWGADLGQDCSPDGLTLAGVPAVPHSALDAPVVVSLLPAAAAGHGGRPGLVGSRSGGAAFPDPVLRSVQQDAADRVCVTGTDQDCALTVVVTLRLHPAGLLEIDASVRNDGDEPYALELLAPALPVPDRARELMDLSGRWTRERDPQRHPFVHGAHVRETRHGRTGHDTPLVLAAGTPGFGHRSGEVWGVHLAWSGDACYRAERSPSDPALLSASELLVPGEVILEPGETYLAPTMFAAWSGAGLDGIAAAFHDYLRARPGHPRAPRPVVLNTWEAVYFDHDLTRLTRLADVAAEIGVERFVLDDGWFLGRRDDTKGLGDWEVDPDLWPAGLTPLIEHVTGLGMSFGLWVEPEMVNLDSGLARAHPDWVLRPDGPVWRQQHVLDLTVPEAWEHVLGRLDALLTENDVAFLKWDQNRDLVAPQGRDGRPVGRAQTLAAYRLLDALRAQHPGVEIESCASGGARIDLGILARTDRVWASDTNDALERQHVQAWTGLLLPPELVGAHVGPPQAHTTGRVGALGFRVATAMFGSFGFEWDVTTCSPEERGLLREAVTLHKRLRPLLHGGRAVRADLPDPSADLHGVVTPDHAVFAFVQLTTSSQAVPAAVPLPGLDPDRRYRVTPLVPPGGARTAGRADPPWWSAGGVTLTGRELSVVGLRLPVLAPEQCVLLELTSV